MKHSVATLSTLISLTALCQIALAGPFTNGGFESPGNLPDKSEILLTNADPRLTGWVVGGPGGPVTLANGTFGNLDFPAVDGTYQLVFNGGNLAPGTWLSQTFDTAVGQDYLVTFYVGQLGPAPGDMSITATAISGAGGTLGYMNAVPPSHGYGGPQSLLFTATTPTTTLRLQDTSIATVSVDVALDAVSMVAAAPNSNTVTASAYIDGRSQLVIRQDALWWNHLANLRPGRGPGVNYPTFLNSYSWYPAWPDNNDGGPGISGLLSVSAQFSTNGVSVAARTARGPVTIVQQPTDQNDFTLILEFDDTLPDGAAFYQVTLSGISLGILPVLSIQVASVALTFPAELNRFYQLQYTPTLPATNWISLGAPIQGFGTNIVITDSILGQPTKMYRVVPLP